MRRTCTILLAILIGALALTGLSGVSAAAVPTPTSATTLSNYAPAAVARAATTPKRVRAMRYAKTKAGGWYRYGGNGPSSFDCSGLVKWAYGKAGISLPRTAGDQRSSSKTRAVSRSGAKWGDLVFWGTGHVEFFGHHTKTGFWSFGAHHSGTRIGYRFNSWSGYGASAHFEHVVGAG